MFHSITGRRSGGATGRPVSVPGRRKWSSVSTRDYQRNVDASAAESSDIADCPQDDPIDANDDLVGIVPQNLVILPPAGLPLPNAIPQNAPNVVHPLHNPLPPVLPFPGAHYAPLLPNVPPPVPPPNPQPLGLAIHRARSDRAFYCLARKTRFCLTEKDLDMMFFDAQAIRSGDLAVEKKDVVELENNWLTMYAQEEFFSCPLCDGIVAKELDNCPNVRCEGHLARRNTVSEKKRYTTMDIFHQLEEILRDNMDNILSHHNDVHMRAANTSADIRWSDHYRDRMEDVDMYRRREIVIQLNISSDGFSYSSGNYRGELWPINLAIVDLDPALRYASNRIILAGCVRSRTKPKVVDMNRVLTRLLALPTRALRISHNQQDFTVTCLISSSSMDHQAISLLYDISSYENGSCAYCTMIFPRVNHRYEYSFLNGRPKDRAYCAHHAIAGTGGFRSETVMSRLVPLSDNIIDLMHTYTEGILKDILRDHCHGNRRPMLSINNATIALFDDSSSKALFPTYHCIRLLPLSKLNHMSAKELNLFSFIGIPLLASSNLYNNLIGGAYTWLLTSMFRRLHDENVTRDVVLQVANDLRLCSRLWTDVYGLSSITYKCHVFFCHVTHQLDKYGNIVDIDVSGYESQNKVFKQLINPLVTNGFDQATEKRILLQYRIEAELCERAVDSVVPGIQKMYNDIIFSKNRGMRNSVSLLDSTRVPSTETALPPPGDPNRHLFDELTRVAGQFLVYYDRLYWRGYVIASHTLRPRPAMTQQDLVVLNDNGEKLFGQVLLFALDINTRQTYVLVKLLETMSVSETYSNRLRALYSANGQQLSILFDRYVNDQQYIRKLFRAGINPNPVYETYNTSAIVSLVAYVPFSGEEYVVSLPSKKVWN